MRKFIIFIFSFVTLLLIIYWSIFIKSTLIVDKNLISICINKNKLDIELAESAKYISSFETQRGKDTIEIFVRTTTIYNPFAIKGTNKTVELSSNIKYIKVGDKLMSIESINQCNPQIRDIRIE